MTWESWTWVAWWATFAVVEGIGLWQKDRPGHPRTLSAQIWWLIQGAGLWHRLARVGLVAALAWLALHLLSGGWA